MSWGFEITGSKDGVTKKVVERLDKLAETYAGKPEADDIVACKGRILALIEACDLSVDQYGSEWNAVIVKASGSHGWTDTEAKKLSTASFQVSVTRTFLAL